MEWYLVTEENMKMDLKWWIWQVWQFQVNFNRILPMMLQHLEVICLYPVEALLLCFQIKCLYLKVISLLCLSVTHICLQTSLLLNLQITCLYLVASLLVFLMKRDVLDKPECSSVRHIWTGAAPLSVKLQQLVLEKLAGSAVLHHSYGLTETTFTMFTCTVDNCRLGTPGRVTPGMECKVPYM